MDSMRREALAPFWPQLSANGYFNDQRMAPNVYTSAGNTMARNYQVFNADQTRDANLTAMYSLFSGGRDYYGYKAAAARADAARQMLRGTEVDVAMQARLDYIAALRESGERPGDGRAAARRRGAAPHQPRDVRGRPRPALLRAARRGGAGQRGPDGRHGAEPGRAVAGVAEDHAGRGSRLADHAGRPPRVHAGDAVSIEEGIRQASETPPGSQGRGQAAGGRPRPRCGPPTATTSRRSPSATCTTGPG